MRRGPGEFMFLATLKHALHGFELHVRVCKLGCLLGSPYGFSPPPGGRALIGPIMYPKGLFSLGTSNRGASSLKGVLCSLTPFLTVFKILWSSVHSAFASRLVSLFSRKGWHIKLKDSSPGFNFGFFFVILFHLSPLSSTSISNNLVSYFIMDVTGRGITSGRLGGGGRGGG